MVRGGGALPGRFDGGGVPGPRLAEDARAAERATGGASVCGTRTERDFVFEGGREQDDLHGGRVALDGLQRRCGEPAGRRQDHGVWQRAEPERRLAYADVPLHEEPGKHRLQRTGADGFDERGRRGAGKEASGDGRIARGARGDERLAVRSQHGNREDGGTDYVSTAEWDGRGAGS